MAAPPRPPQKGITATGTETYTSRPPREAKPSLFYALPRCRVRSRYRARVSHSLEHLRAVALDHDAEMNLRDALCTRCDQWTANMRQPLTDAQLDAALSRSIPTTLAPFIAPDTEIDDAGVRAISDVLMVDLEARGDEHKSAPFWIVHDSSGTTESDVMRGVAFVVARILIAAESRLLDVDAYRFPKLSGLRATAAPDVQGWLDECIKHGTIPASALTRHPELLSMTEPDNFRLLTLADPTTDRGWSAADLTQFARGFVRRPEFVDALVRVTVEGVQSAPWVVAVETIRDVREAADGLPWGAAHS